MAKDSDGEVDVLVLGAGPVGLTVASEVRRFGARARVVDKAPGTKTITKAMILHVRTQEVLDAVGVLDVVKARSVPLRTVELHAYGKHIGRWNLEGIDTPVLHPVILGQDRTERLLGEHLRTLGPDVEWNVEATGLRQNDDGVEVTLRHADGREETARAKYVVGCEGSNSMVRKALGFSFEGERYEGEQFIQADCKIRWSLPKGTSYLFLTEHGYMMVIEMPGDTVRVFVSLPDDAAKGSRDPHEIVVEDKDAVPTLREIQDALNRLSGLDAELEADTWRARYRTSHRYANRFREGRAFIAGDAGHVHVPIGGQGMNTGIQDGFNLGWKLALVAIGRAPAALLDTYDAERHPVAAALIRGTDRAYRFVLHANDTLRAAARLFGPYVMRLEGVQTRFRNTLEEIEIAYGPSALVEEAGRGEGPSAGERVVDAVVVAMPQKASVRLWELCAGTHFTLLLVAGQSPRSETYAQLASAAITARDFGDRVRTHLVAVEPPPPGALPDGVSLSLDRQQYLHRRYGGGAPGIYLLRPDRYVGFRGGPEDGGKLAGYLSRNLIPVRS